MGRRRCHRPTGRLLAKVVLCGSEAGHACGVFGRGGVVPLEAGLLQHADGGRIRQFHAGGHGVDAGRGEGEGGERPGGLGGVAPAASGGDDAVPEFECPSEGGQNRPMEPTTIPVSRSMISRWPKLPSQAGLSSRRPAMTLSPSEGSLRPSRPAGRCLRCGGRRGPRTRSRCAGRAARWSVRRGPRKKRNARVTPGHGNDPDRVASLQRADRKRVCRGRPLTAIFINLPVPEPCSRACRAEVTVPDRAQSPRLRPGYVGACPWPDGLAHARPVLGSGPQTSARRAQPAADRPLTACGRSPGRRKGVPRGPR